MSTSKEAKIFLAIHLACSSAQRLKLKMLNYYLKTNQQPGFIQMEKQNAALRTANAANQRHMEDMQRKLVRFYSL